MSSLLRLERKQKNSSNPFRIRIFLFLSYLYSFGIDTINTFMHPRSSFENHTWFQTKMGKNPARWGGTYLYSLYKDVTHPGGGGVEVLYTQSFGDWRRGCSLLQKLLLKPQYTVDSQKLEPSREIEKSRVIGSSKKIAGSKEKTVLRHSEHFNHS